MLRECLTKSGVNLTHLAEVPGPTGTALILLQKSGVCLCMSAHGGALREHVVKWGMLGHK